ncbi:MAG: FtsX-like permease family protein [Pseudomonadales bacterium]|nr:FtsX-like permease family protein [Pseudomonadales bacterium]
MTTLLARAHLRHLGRERWQALLALLGVAVGVAVVVAVDLVNASSREAMRIASQQLSGEATHVIVGPGERVDERRYADLRRAFRARSAGFERVRAIAPLVTGAGRLAPAEAPADGGLRVRVLGVDPVTDSAVRDLVAAPGEGADFDGARLLTEPGAVLLDARSATRLGLAPGAAATLRTAAGLNRVSVLGVLPAAGDALGEGLLLADIATAQELLGRRGWIDRVDLVMDAPAPAEGAGAFLERLFPGLVVLDPEPVTAVLPGGLRIESVAERTEDTRALASAFQLNLAALGLLAIVVGLFLIHGALRFSVLRRQRQFGGLRALGVTPRELARLVMLEAAVLGVLGALLGLGLGRLLAGALLGLVSATLEGLYDQVAIGALAFDPVPWLKGAAVGVGGALMVAAPSARAAAQAPPRLLQLGELDEAERRRVPVATALLCLLVALLGLLPGTGYLGGLVAIAALLLGAAALTPALVRAGIGGLARLAALAPLGLRMYLRESARGLTRSGVASAALLVAVATAVGMGVMVESFRGSVEHWLSARLSASLYLRLPGDEALPQGVRSLLDERASSWLERLTFRDRIEGRPVNVTRVTVHGPWPEALDRVLLAGAWDGSGALVSEPLARELGLPLTDGGLGAARLTVDTGRGPVALPVAGVYREYGGGRGSVTLPAGRWPDPPPGLRTFEIFGVDDVEAVAGELAAALPEAAELRRNREILELSLGIFDRTFRVTGVLQTLAGLVAAIGLFGALSALALERQAQYGVMRTLGVRRRAPALASLAESLLVALLAASLALPVGVAVAVVLLDVVNVRAFGWSLALDLPPGLFLEALLVALLAGGLAAVAPAWRLWRETPARMLAHARAFS